MLTVIKLGQTAALIGAPEAEVLIQDVVIGRGGAVSYRVSWYDANTRYEEVVAEEEVIEHEDGATEQIGFRCMGG